MAANLAGANIATLVVKVSAADIPNVLVFNLEINQDGYAFGTIRVPPGSERLITVQAFDEMGLITHEGAALVNVNPGQNPPVFIALVPRAGQVPLEIVMGDIFIWVYGSTTGAQGGQLQLAAEAWGPLGPVNAELEWASENPAIATVSQDGLVSLLIPGKVRIYAVSAGYSGYIEITVLPTGMALVTGAVYNVYTGMPVSNAVITVDGMGYVWLEQNGSFSIQLLAGTYQIGVAPNAPECVAPADQEVTLAEGNSAFLWIGVECGAGISNNETDSPVEMDYCIVKPSSVNAEAGSIVDIFGEVFEPGWTEWMGDPGFLAQAGFGYPGTDPTIDPTWSWEAASYNMQVGNNDEYVYSIGPLYSGLSLAYAFRFSQDGGASWTYCDADGAGSNEGLTFSAAQLGTLTTF